MYMRLLKLPKNRSFFLFGARNTGKSTLIEEQFPDTHCIRLDLLDTRLQERFLANPEELFDIVNGLPPEITHVVIDEIQKAPKLLDVVQRLLKKKDRYFALTGSSARKLKRGGANLLAGRAFVYHLYPLTFVELGKDFNLELALNWGTLPEIMDFSTNQERHELLTAYAHTYLREEIWEEQIIKTLAPFRKFLEVAAQCNGKIVNFSNIAREVGIDDKTAKAYFEILDDTLIGFFLEPHHNSVRKQVSGKPKFYFLDTGLTRALARQLDVPLRPGTHAYGNAFEHYIITEIMRLASYLRRQYKFSYLRTSNDVEVDLIIERPGEPTIYIEIKSTDNIQSSMLTYFKKITSDAKDVDAICLSNDPFAKKFDHVIALPWQEGIKKIFGDYYNLQN
ncbi:MAG: AAA family ATPase [Pseudomonadota bacterium]|nr:AAA family ATPase [Pseudomonadota bacterium]